MEPMLKYLDFMCNMQQETAPHDVKLRLSFNKVKVEVRKKLHGKVWARVAEYALQIDSEKPSESVELGSQHGVQMVGTRHRLKALKIEDTDPFPCDGKVRTMRDDYEHANSRRRTFGDVDNL